MILDDFKIIITIIINLLVYPLKHTLKVNSFSLGRKLSMYFIIHIYIYILYNSDETDQIFSLEMEKRIKL